MPGEDICKTMGASDLQNSRAVLAALKGLQDKLRYLEVCALVPFRYINKAKAEKYGASYVHLSCDRQACPSLDKSRRCACPSCHSYRVTWHCHGRQTQCIYWCRLLLWRRKAASVFRAFLSRNTSTAWHASTYICKEKT